MVMEPETHNSVTHRRGATYSLRGVRTVEHFFTVPLDYASDTPGETLDVFAREYVSESHSEAAATQLPWLLFLQGGPGGKGARVAELGGWMKEAAKNFHILMLDQRGTGRSSYVSAATLSMRGGPVQQADYLTHFRADSIVRDAESIRTVLSSAPWTIFGQSFGGFCVLTYLSLEPQGVHAALVTGGLAPLTGGPDRVYQATYARVTARNAEYFAKYPEDRGRVNAVIAHLRSNDEHLPTGERLSVQRFQMVGNYLGGNTRIDALHFLLEEAFMDTADGTRLSDTFLQQVGALVTRASNCLYAVMHESIYCQGSASNWSAERVLESHPGFSPTADEPLLFGEMVYQWYFEEDPALIPLKETAGILAQRTDWPDLYNLDVLAANTVPTAAAVYLDDIYVDHGLSMETVSRVRGLQAWESGDFHHDGIADDGEAIFRRLLSMVGGAPVA
ncbi:alpha/beta fold hydrolase [Arthrobacter roseus]